MSRDGKPQEGAAAYAVSLTDEAYFSYAAIQPNSLFEHVDRNLELLGLFPELGRIYEPAYPAACLPFESRVLYCGHLGIYYTVDEQARAIVVFAIEDQRRNPLTRFASL